MHVAVTTIDKLLDYVMNNPQDGLRSAETVKTINSIIDNNKKSGVMKNKCSFC